MRIQVKVIRFTLFMSVFFAVITYLVTLNIEIGFLVLSVPWLSNSLVLTVCGGAFASMLVVLIGEVQKYFLNKKTAEEFLFSHVAYVYGQLKLIKTHIQKRIDDPLEIVPAELLSLPSDSLKREIALISGVDYYSFSRFHKNKSNNLMKTYQRFCDKTLEKLAKFVNSANYLNIAVKKDQIDYLKIYGWNGVTTSASPYTGQALKKFNSLINPLIEEIDLFLQSIDLLCNNRFKWEIKRDKILNDWDKTSYHGFDQFLKQEGDSP